MMGVKNADFNMFLITFQLAYGECISRLSMSLDFEFHPKFAANPKIGHWQYSEKVNLVSYDWGRVF